MEPAQPVQSPQPVQPAQPAKAPNGFGVTALVVGIVAFLLAWTGFFGLILAIVALVFGILALVKKQSKGMGITGIVLGSLALITALFFMLVGLALFGGAVQVANEVAKEQQAVDSAKKAFAVGETAEFGKLTVKVNTFTPNWTSDNEFMTPKDGYEYAYVSLNIKNTSDETVSVNPYDYSVNDSGIVSGPAIVTTPTPLNAVELKPGSSVDGDIVFEVKKGATNLTLEYKTYDTTFKEVTYSLAL